MKVNAQMRGRTPRGSGFRCISLTQTKRDRAASEYLDEAIFRARLKVGENGTHFRTMFTHDG